MWSDNEANVDLLRFGYLAEAIVGVVTTQHLLPVTVGIYGDWGGGKSTLIRLVQAALIGKPQVMTLQFNGWLFEGYEDAKTALMGAILDAIEDQLEAEKTLGDRARDLLGKLKRRVNWLQLARMTGRYAVPVLAGLPHVALASVGTDLMTLVRNAVEEKGGFDVEEAKKLLVAAPEGEDNIRRNIRDFRKDFADLLTESKIETLVVFIDDLDRCLPDTVIETLEAIKLFLFVKGTAFVIGADEQLIQYAVRQRFPELPGTAIEVGRDYLEKLVQVPVRIPPLSGSEIESYMNLLFAELRLSPDIYAGICSDVATFQPENLADCSFSTDRARILLPDGNIPEDLQRDLDLTAQIVPVLTPGLNGNPRRAKRFLNTLLLRMSMSASRGLNLERRVLAKVMLLEYIRPEFFRELAALQAAEGGRPHALLRAEEFIRAKLSTATVASEATNEEPPTSPSHEDTGGAGQTQPRSLRASERPRTSDQRSQPEDTLPPPVQPWLADDWTRTWLVSDPPLGTVDLRPYFYIAHDRIGSLGDIALRLSPAAADVLNRLLDSGDATQAVGLKRAESLGHPDALSVFQALAQRIRQAELLDERSVQGVLFKLGEIRHELLPQLITLYGTLPDTKITMGTPVALLRLTADTPSAGAARNLVDRWSRSPQTILARAAQSGLNRQQRPARRT